MQELFKNNPNLLTELRASISESRLKKYMGLAGNDEVKAILLYQWNARLAQSLYIYLQGWEICLRNKLNNFLSWKYNRNWPYDQARCVRQLSKTEMRRLSEAVQRQESERRASPASTSAIVADLSAGFWVALLSSSYDVPYAWRYNLARVFPHDTMLVRPAAWEACDRILSLRNRVAHHEPILHLPLDQRYVEMQRIVAAMCPGTFVYCEETCSFREVWGQRP